MPIKKIATTLPKLEEQLMETAAQLELFRESPMSVQDAFTRLELIDRALMIRVSMLELKVKELEDKI